MGLRDWFRRKQAIKQAQHGKSLWFDRKLLPRQVQGPIVAPRRNTDLPVTPGPANRASRREYVRGTNRGNRKYVAGWGNWRSHDGQQRTNHRVAMGRHRPPQEPRWLRRIEHAVQYRAHRKNRSTRITPR